MRYTTTINATGASRPRSQRLRRTVILVAFVLAALWAAYVYAQEAYLSRQLGQQASDLRHQNAVIAAQNQGYHKDVQAITTGAADEEEARLNGYSRPRERLYLITPIQSPAPASPTPTPRASPTPKTP